MKRYCFISIPPLVICTYLNILCPTQLVKYFVSSKVETCSNISPFNVFQKYTHHHGLYNSTIILKVQTLRQLNLQHFIFVKAKKGNRLIKILRNKIYFDDQNDYHQLDRNLDFMIASYFVVKIFEQPVPFIFTHITYSVYKLGRKH